MKNNFNYYNNLNNDRNENNNFINNNFNENSVKLFINHFIKDCKGYYVEHKKVILYSLIIVAIIVFLTLVCFISFYIYKYVNRDIKQVYEVYNSSKFDSDKYPGYKELLDEVISKHPNWNITLFYTQLDWNDVIKNEGHKDDGSSPTNLIADYKDYPKDYECDICNGKKYDNGSWLCASDKAIKHQMDPRNFLSNELIYQFKELSFDEESQNIKGLREITKNSFLKEDYILKSLIEAGKKANIDCYFIASRLIQEQGRKGSTLSRGYVYNDRVVYNPFNINAKGNSTKEILNNAGEYAFNNNWFSLDKALIEGVDFVKKDYIDKGQNTLYFQKFDIVKNVLTNKEDRINNKYRDLYINQYMQNLFAPESEAKNMVKFYKSSDTYNNNANFIIPIYENMGLLNDN